jgi:hypothetical protein
VCVAELLDFEFQLVVFLLLLLLVVGSGFESDGVRWLE